MLNGFVLDSAGLSLASLSGSESKVGSKFSAKMGANSLKRSGDKGHADAQVRAEPAINSAALAKPEPKVVEGQTEYADGPLVDRARAGDLQAFRELVERYQNRALSIAIGVVGSREDAEDVVQEAFLKAYRNLGSFRGQSSFYTWLYRIVFNLAIDLSRKRYRRSETNVGDHSSMDVLSHHSSGDVSDFLGSVPDPDQAMQRTELGQSIARALDSLSAEHRAVIVLREIDGLSYSEISDVVGCSKGTVMSRLHHARKRLQRALSGYMIKRARTSDEPNETDDAAALAEERAEQRGSNN